MEEYVYEGYSNCKDCKDVRTHNVATKRQNFSKAAGARNGIQVSRVIYWTA